MEGKVVRWINSFGFIKARDGQRVTFDVAESERGPLAKRIKVIEAPCA